METEERGIAVAENKVYVGQGKTIRTREKKGRLFLSRDALKR